MSDEELRVLLAQLEEKSAEQAPYFNDRLLTQIGNVKKLLADNENE
tara:strand:+ start:661 stop:798 length:138 start_codon:yes stop_codon:yes gene_type:complete